MLRSLINWLTHVEHLLVHRDCTQLWYVALRARMHVLRLRHAYVMRGYLALPEKHGVVNTGWDGVAWVHLQSGLLIDHWVEVLLLLERKSGKRSWLLGS